MEIPLFQWSQISKHPEWMPQINAWFDRFPLFDDAHSPMLATGIGQFMAR